MPLELWRIILGFYHLFFFIFQTQDGFVLAFCILHNFIIIDDGGTFIHNIDKWEEIAWPSWNRRNQR